MTAVSFISEKQSKLFAQELFSSFYSFKKVELEKEKALKDPSDQI